jgi:hypothetical protein
LSFCDAAKESSGPKKFVNKYAVNFAYAVSSSRKVILVLDEIANADDGMA